MSTMSRAEQDALLAFVNMLKSPSTRRVNVFSSLADGRTLMECMSQIDGTHFKATPARAGPGAGPSENWVLKMNSLKRLYRLLLSYPLPPERPSLSLTTLPEPDFSAVARFPMSTDGQTGLVQICRFCLCIGVWGNGNVKVVAKIQRLEAQMMAELMRCIEEVSESLPEPDINLDDQGPSTPRRGGSRRSSPEKPAAPSIEPKAVTPPGGLRAERDKLIRDNDELRDRCAKMKDDLTETAAALDMAKQEKEDALARLSAAREASATGLRTSQSATSEIDGLRTDLATAEESVHRAESEIEKQRAAMKDLTKQLDEVRPQAEEAVKLRDQLDEHRHLAERLQKSENVIEKYRKKLDETAKLRRDYKRLEEENAQMVSTISSLEQQQRKAGARSGGDDVQAQLEGLARRSAEQAQEIERLEREMSLAQDQLEKAELSHERDKEDLQLLRERMKELDLAGMQRTTSQDSFGLPQAQTLSAELESAGPVSEPRQRNLESKIRSLEQELEQLRSAPGDVSGLNKLLSDAIKARDTYQSECFAAQRESAKLQKEMETVTQFWEELANPHLVPLSEDKRRRRNDEDFSRLRAAVVNLGITEPSLQFLRALYDSDPDFASRLRSPHHNERAAIEQKHLAATLQQPGLGASKTTIAYLEEVHKWNTDFRDRIRQAQDTLDERLGKPPRNRHEDINTGGPSFVSYSAPDVHEPAVYLKGAQASGSAEEQVLQLQAELKVAKDKLEAAERHHSLESNLMVSAWHDLGSRTIEKHLSSVMGGVKRSGAVKPVPLGWLGRQRRYQEDAIYSRA